MSGTEASFLVGILRNTIRLLESSCNAMNRIKETKEHSFHLPKVFWTLQDQLPLIAHALKITSEQLHSNELDERTCEALSPVIEDCEMTLKRLNQVLDTIPYSTEDQKRQQNFRAITSCFHDKEVLIIAESLSRSLTVINRYHVAYTSTTTGSILRTLTAAAALIPDRSSQGDDGPTIHFMVPTIWSDDFSGREDTMSELEKAMMSFDKHCRVALVGLGGVGKTRVMIEYAYHFKDSETHSVFWIHASSRTRVEETCLEIAKSAKIQGWDDPAIDKLELVSQWLESPMSGQWILLMDNADDFDLLFGTGNLNRHLPRSDSGAILLTTRDSRVGMEFAKRTTIQIEALKLEDSISLLENRLGAEESELEGLIELSDELCGIPLALVQAASFIQQNYLTIPDYLKLYRASDKDKIELLSEEFDDEIRDAETLNPIAATWSITFDHILKTDPLAAEILSIMSCLASQAIPESLLDNGMPKIKFSKAMGILQAFTLVIARNNDHVTRGRKERFFDFHRMVRLAMRSWLSANGKLVEYTAKTLTKLAERFNEGEWETRGEWSAYMPHATVLLASEQVVSLEQITEAPTFHQKDGKTIAHKPEGVVCPVCTGIVLTDLAHCHYTMGSIALSLEHAERAYSIKRQFLGANHADTIATLDLISRPAKDLYLFRRAVEACKLAIAGKTETLGKDHPSTLTSMATLGTAYRPMDKLENAKEIGLRVLETRRKVLGDRHPDTFASMTYVATAFRALGNYDLAVKIETEKVEGLTESHGALTPKTIEAKACLAWALACQGEYARAAPMNLQSLNQQLEVKGAEFWFTLWTMHNMAVIMGMQGRYQEAEEICQRTLTLRIKHMKATHPFVYVSKLYLAWLYNEIGLFKEAEAIESEVLEFQRTFYGSETHNDVLHTKSQLASTYCFTGRHVEADILKREVLAARLMIYGDQHPATLRCRSSLGMSCVELGSLEEADALLTDAWFSQKNVLGPEHPETLTTMSRVAHLFKQHGRRREAEKCYGNVLDISKKILGPDHPRTEKRKIDLENFISNERRTSHLVVPIFIDEEAVSVSPTEIESEGQSRFSVDLSVDLSTLLALDGNASDTETEVELGHQYNAGGRGAS